MGLLLPPKLVGLFDLELVALSMQSGYFLKQSFKLCLVDVLLSFELDHYCSHFLVEFSEFGLLPAGANLKVCSQTINHFAKLCVFVE